MQIIWLEMTKFFAKRKQKLNFNILKKRPSCGYGRLDDDFEQVGQRCLQQFNKRESQLIRSFRDRFPTLSTEKDMPRTDHPELPDELFAKPIFAHIAHSKSTNEDFNGECCYNKVW